jgi:bacterioferritin (cytochrome b1)
MLKLAEVNPAKLIDLLAERLAYERRVARLYDRAIARLAGSTQRIVRQFLEAAEVIRDQEREHVDWLEQQIRALGGNGVQGDKAKLIEIESAGIEQVISDDRDLGHLFHALYAAELIDDAGWDVLVDLAEEADDEPARREFKKRLRQEEDHLALVKNVVERLLEREVLEPTT